ncbi:hypothetical protein [Arthrobacter sp. D1-17]
MRSFVSALAVVIALLLSAVAVPAIWVDRNIVQEDGFVALAAPLGKDPVFQQRLAAAAVGGIDAGGAIPEPVAGIVRPLLESAAASLSGLPGYPAAWEETLRKSHRLNFAAGTASSEAGPGTTVTLDVAPLVALATTQISERAGVPLEAPAQTLLTVGQPNQRQQIEQVAAYAPLGYSLAIGAGIAFLLAFVAARRRWTVFVGAGIGALGLAGVWTVGSRLASETAVGTASGNEVADLFVQEFVSASTRGFGSWITTAAITGAVLVAAGLAGRLLSGRARQA